MALFLAMGEISWLHLSSLHTEIPLRFPEVQGLAKSWHVVCVRFLIVLFYKSWIMTANCELVLQIMYFSGLPMKASNSLSKEVGSNGQLNVFW